LPKAVFHEVPQEPYTPYTRPAYYIKHIDKTEEEIDELVEYDMDSEDDIWLTQYNKTRPHKSSDTHQHYIDEDAFEMIIDRLEKEAFKLLNNDEDDDDLDADVVCSICEDGYCEDTNQIVFCDGCDVAVHQVCYGIALIPEGRWLCKRCQEEQPEDIECILCPSKWGAFKPTNDARWAHVACALWIPETGFENIETMERVKDISSVPKARWRLICSICKKRTGACIQCKERVCTTAFHVTCAQRKNLYMEVKEDDEAGNNQYIAFCTRHTPKDSRGRSLNRAKRIRKRKRKRKSLTPSTFKRFTKRKHKKLDDDEEENVGITPEEAENNAKIVLERTHNRLEFPQHVISSVFDYWWQKSQKKRNATIEAVTGKNTKSNFSKL